jgi:hypothetical protein
LVVHPLLILAIPEIWDHIHNPYFLHNFLMGPIS